MADLSSIFSAQNGASPWLSAGGTLLSAYGQSQSGISHAEWGQQQLAASQFQAEQLRQNANTALAASQRDAFTQGQQTQIVNSRALALAAASGGGASDPTVVNMMARTAGEGAYRQAALLYGGDERARQMNMQANATEYSGEASAQNANKVNNASQLGAITTLMKGGSSLYSRFGGGGPKSLQDDQS